MANILVQSDSEQSPMEMTYSTRATIDRKLIVAPQRLHSKNPNTELVELLARLSELVDGFVRLSCVSQSEVDEQKNPHHWNIFECANAILSIASAHGGTRFQPPPDNYPACYLKTPCRTTLTTPCATCIGVRSSVITKSCSQAETW